MICSNCQSELGYVDVDLIKSSDYSKYICGVCMVNLVPDSNSPIEDIPNENDIYIHDLEGANPDGLINGN